MPGTKTVVMPVLIAALGIGMVIFYFLGKPTSKEVSTAGRSAIAKATPTPEEKSPSVEVQKVTVAPATGSAAVPPDAGKDLPILGRERVSDEDFTSWMSPLAIDTFIRQRNRGSEKNYWERGHWIQAVEGRWENGAHEFRIAIAKMPEETRHDWYYRIDQTEAVFSETLDRLEKEGYTLAQSHAYDHPDGTKRYQGVWQKEASTLTASEASHGLIGAVPGLQALDVSQRNFR